jgi:hypothetical protein
MASARAWYSVGVSSSLYGQEGREAGHGCAAGSRHWGIVHPPAVLHDLLQAPDGMTPVQLSDGRRVFTPEGSDPDAVRQHVLDRKAA